MGSRKLVYNLEFPSWCPEIDIFGYRFYRVEDYKTKVAELHHLITAHSEFSITVNPGTHMVTAYVDILDNEKEAVLEWSGSGHTALNDILLLLSVFTGREVFVLDEDVYETRDLGLTADPRIYQWGGIIRASVPYKHKSTAVKPPVDAQLFDIIDTEEGEQWIPIEGPYDPSGYNIGFEECLNDVYNLIRTEDWRREYQQGYFLFLARSAFRRQTLESAFLQCWTLWEHLFAVLNSDWLSRTAIHQLPSFEKISFVLTKYLLQQPINDSERKRLEQLAEIRNRLIHFGRFPPRNTTEEAEALEENAVLFIRLTESVIAKILGLQPSNVFNTQEKLRELLNG
jgi:hypothetical protein